MKNNIFSKSNYMDNYKIIRFINKGSYGSIYLVENKNNNTKYDLKTIKILNIDK